MSGNHRQSLEVALAIVDAAADAGAHAVKLQTYTADTITMNVRDRKEFWQNSDESLWCGSHLYDLFDKAMTPWEWHKEIMDHAKSRGLLCFSSPFDESAVDFLEGLDVPCYKIASPENVDLHLIRKVAQTGKPVIASTGTATLDDIHFLTTQLELAGCPKERQLILKCTSSYPASPKEANVATIPHMAQMIGTQERQLILKCTSSYPASLKEANIATVPHMAQMIGTPIPIHQVGLSDHSHGIGVAVAAVALGATMVEKHFTLSRADGGVDCGFSLEPDELKALVVESKRAWEAVGKVSYSITMSEQLGQKYKRSIYVSRDVGEGEVLTKENTRCIRPGAGLCPKYYDIVLGKRVNRALVTGTPLSWDHIG